MARMIPELSDVRLADRPFGEAAVYRACRDRLAADMVVLYSVPILHRDRRVYEGEADFVVLDPNGGILVIEVKGGGISHDPVAGTWTTRNRDGKSPIDDPFLQATANQHVLLKILQAHPRWAQSVRGWTLAGHAVLFPDLTRRQLSVLRLPHTPPAIVGSGDDLDTFPAWLTSVDQFYRGPHDVPLGRAGVDLASELLCKRIEVDAPRSARLREQEAERLILTDQQSIVLESVAERPRVAVSGGAGTGKTLLALLTARRRAEAGERPLLLCFNRMLAAHLKDVTHATGVDAMGVHAFYTWWISVVSKKLGRNLLAEARAQFPGQSHTEVVLPQAFSVALETEPPPYDSVIVDEGQDFHATDWLAIDALIERTGARLLVFYDHNQMLYPRNDCFPIEDADCVRLTRNCRHTAPIHHASYRRHYHGPPTRPSPISGDPPVPVHAARGEQAREVRKVVQKLLSDGVRPGDIAVLVLDLDERAGMCRAALPPLAGIAWSEGYRGDGVCVESVNRFKGLDAAVIVLWLASEFDTGIHREWVYVGLSRAKSWLYVVGTAEMCNAVL